MRYGESSLPVLISQEGQCWICNWECLYRDLSPDIQQNIAQYGKIAITSEKILHISTDADSITDTKKILVVRENFQKKHIFFCAAILHPL